MRKNRNAEGPASLVVANVQEGTDVKRSCPTLPHIQYSAPTTWALSWTTEDAARLGLAGYQRMNSDRQGSLGRHEL